MLERPPGSSEINFPAQKALEKRARQAVKLAGYRVGSINLTPEGRSYNNFAVTLVDESSMIARFEKPQAVDSPDEIRRDLHFNGPLTLTRERNLMELVRDQAGLPVPKVYGQYSNEYGTFLLVEKLPGIYWSNFMEQRSHSLAAYLQSLKFLGRDLAQVHKVKFESYGDVISKDFINPGTITDFPERIRMVTELKRQRAKYSGALSDEELHLVENYVQTELGDLTQMLKDTKQQPVLILTDIHPMNFFVDDDGKPSGYFDLESCQAAHPALEFNLLRATLLNYFDGVSRQAEEALLTGYWENGGTYDPQAPINKKIEQLLGIGYLVAAVTAYHNAADGLRDTWSAQLKQILLEAMRSDVVDWEAISNVYRSKTRQPRFPSSQ